MPWKASATRYGIQRLSLRQATEPVGALDTNVKLARVVEAGPRVIAAAAADAVHGQLGWAKENLPHRRKPAVPPRVECRGLGRQGSGDEQASEDQAQGRGARSARRLGFTLARLFGQHTE